MFFILYILWIVFNGKITFEILWLGALICGGIYLLCWKFFGYDIKKERSYYKKIPLVIKYLFVLMVEILKANLVVVKLVLSGKKVNPVLVEFSTGLRTEAAKFILSHSITLTPGTITVELKEDAFVVHCLDKSMSGGMEDSHFVQLLKKMEN